MAEFTRERVLEASDAWQWVPSGAQALEICGVPVVVYPEWARMGFYATPTNVREPAADVIRAVRAAARDHGRSEISWWISPSTNPALIERALADTGAVLSERTEILALGMADGPPDLKLNAEIECRLVGDAQTLDDAERVAANVWGGAPSSGDRRGQQLKSLRHPLDETGGFRVVAYLNGTAVATAGCQVADDVARLYGAGTLEDARGVGAYRATIAKRLEIAFEHGARMGLVHARVNTSKPILTRLGFASFGEARLYALSV